MTSVHWLQIVAAVHLGLHWKMLASFFCTVMHINPGSFFASRLMPALFLVISGYGVSVFIAQNLLAYLAGQVDFSFFAYENAGTLFYVDYLCVVVAMAWIMRVLMWALFFRPRS